jgi:hypothetical protein
MNADLTAATVVMRVATVVEAAIVATMVVVRAATLLVAASLFSVYVE